MLLFSEILSYLLCLLGLIKLLTLGAGGAFPFVYVQEAVLY